MIDKTLNQYIELYEANRPSFDTSEALTAKRQWALDALLSAGRLPRKGDEGYARFSVEDIFSPDYGINVSRLDMGVSTAKDGSEVLSKFRCGVPNISTLLIYVYNDKVIIPRSTLTNMPDGVEVSSLGEAVLKCGDASSRLASISGMSGEKASALNTLLWQDGVLIRVKKGVELTKPLQIVNIVNSTIPMAVFRRVMIVMETGSRARVLFCDHTEASTPSALVHQVAEVFVEPNADLELYDLEESGETTSRLWQLFARLDKDSSLHTNISSLRSGRARNEINVDFAGEGASYDGTGMTLADESSIVDNSSRINHRMGHCDSRQLYKYVLRDKAQGAFEGLVTVGPDAVKTVSEQTDKNLMLSPEARMHSEPQLLILCDDVKCTHGATTGQIDQKALFYLRSRGIPMKEAESMLVRSFMVDVIDSIKLGPLRDRMHHLVDMRLSGSVPANCLTCRAHGDKNDIQC